jgi:hypothetical protein
VDQFYGDKPDPRTLELLRSVFRNIPSLRASKTQDCHALVGELEIRFVFVKYGGTLVQPMRQTGNQAYEDK